MRNDEFFGRSGSVATIELENGSYWGERRGTSEADRGRTSQPTPKTRTLAEIERAAIFDALEACDGNQSKAARTLGVSEKTIYNKLKRYRGHASAGNQRMRNATG